jgi:MOSC domain-containing protein YiiM
VRDVGSLFELLPLWWQLSLDGHPDAVLARRPAPGAASALEHADRTARTTHGLRIGLATLLARDGAIIGPSDGDGARARHDADQAPGRLADALAAIVREALPLGRLTRLATPAAWSHQGRTDDATPVSALGLLLHAAHDASHRMFDVARALRVLGLCAPRHHGFVERVNASNGGVPKHAIPGAIVDGGGLAGDRQRDRKHHGRPFQALCLWSSDVIAGLAADGHPIAAGSAGENVTISGVDWAGLRAGTLVRVGSALAELSYPAVPCAKQARWFLDGDFGRIDHSRNPHLARWYAWVREPGAVAAGDGVTVSPSA